MIEVKRTQESHAETDSIGVAFNKTLIKETELWMGAHSDFLASVESMMTDWLRRQREAFDVSSRSVGKDAATLTRKAVQRLGEAARERSSTLRQQSEALSHPATPAAMERAAAE